MLEIRLLGQFDLCRDDHPIEIRSRAAQALLVYLVLGRGVQHRREKLAGILWPDMPEQNARRNLRHALWQVRKAIGDKYIQADRLSIVFDSDAPCWIDVAAFKGNRKTYSLDDMIAAVSLYQGKLLPGFYESWIVPERERLQIVYDRHMGSLLEALEAEARWEDVLTWAERWIAEGDSLEPAFRAMMRAYNGLGNQAGVAACYRRCVETLQDVLGVAPSEETQTLYRLLSQGRPPQETVSSGLDGRETIPAELPVHKTSKFALLRRLTGSRLIGRDYEFAELREFWKRAQGGEGHLLLIAGEAGVGKTRLVRELIREVERQGGSVLQGTYYAEMDVPYLGFWEALRDHLRSMESQLARDTIGQLVPELVKLVPEITELTGPVKPNPPLGTVSAERVRLFDHVSRFIERLAAHTPLLIFLDDLHWADEASTTLLGYVLHHARNVPVLFVSTVRDKEINIDHPLHQKLLDLNRERLYTRLQLHPLPRSQVDRLLSTLLAGPVDSGLAETIADVAGGIPLFVEEIAKSLLEKDAIRLESGRWQQVGEAAVSVPHTIEMMIRTRAASLSEDCQVVLQHAAVLGQSFDPAVLRHMLGWKEKRLLDSLDEAMQSGVVTEAEGREDRRHRFNHALVQQTLYEEFSAWERADAHLSAGEALEAVYAGAIDEHVEILAHHFMHSHEEGVVKAARYLLQAAEKAASVYAHDQAINYLRRGLDLLSNYPALPGKAQDEIRLLLVLGPLLGNTAGRWDDEVGLIFRRAESLCRQIECSVSEYFSAMRGLWHYSFSAGNEEEVLKLSPRLISLAEESGDSGLLLEAYHTLWGWEFGRGNTPRAQEYFERGRELFDFEAHRDLSRRFGHDPGTCCLNMGAFNLWLLGYPDRALQWSQEAYKLGQKMALPFDRLCGINAYVWVYEMRGEHQKAAQWNEKKLALARETEFPQFVIGALGSQGLALAWQGSHEEGFSYVQEAVEENRATSRYETLTFMRFLQVCVLTGHVVEGLRALEDELTRNKITGENALEPEIRRLYGELLRMQTPADGGAAEAQFKLALKIARKQEARSLELRAATSLARLWQSQGQAEQAHQLLQPVYSWFTEGFETADLIEARQLLNINSVSRK